MNTQISNWTGRLGNRLLALVNALTYAIGTNTNLIIPFDDTGFINTTFIQLQDTSSNKILYSNTFFSIVNMPNWSKIGGNQSYREQALEIMKQYVLISPPDKVLDENELVIHIRSGDIMMNNCNWPKEYIPPPYVFYETIFKKTYKKWKKIHIVSEDNNNPCMRKLIQNYPQLIWKKQTLKKDIELILSAKSIIIGGGSFVPSLLLFSNNIKTVFASYMSPVRYLKTRMSHINIYYLSFEKYFTEQIKLGNKNWKCTPQQLYYMLHWPIHKQRSTLKFKHSMYHA